MYVQQCKIQQIILLMIILTDKFYLSCVFVYNNNVQSHDLYYKSTLMAPTVKDWSILSIATLLDVDEPRRHK